MTKTIFVTDLMEVKELKIVCGKCGAYWSLPVGKENPPEQCPYCRTDVPSGEILNVAQALSRLQSAAKAPSYNFGAFFETEAKGG